VTANFKETQLTHMHPGQKAEIHVDAYPHTTFRGHVDSIQSGTGERFSVMPPENATGNYVKIVQRIPVKILIDTPPDSNARLAPGMSVEPTVFVSQ
jgi:membrane fusion protein (multidrug efflux system)